LDHKDKDLAELVVSAHILSDSRPQYDTAKAFG
jgi:hypothetical protein